MAGLGSSLAKLARFRRRFQRLLAVAGAGTSARSARLREVRNFGSNPGNLRMFVYAPDRLPKKPALVVALHGCTQTAAAYDAGTGWSQLADRHGFVVLYPEQHGANNPQSCFSWFLPGDTRREHGEALSIRQMVARASSDFGVDRGRVFVTGLSAGGAMASVMLATYPDVFAGGAIIAGLPYGSAGNVEQGFEAMMKPRTTPARALGDRVRAASNHKGPWPKISVWHGSGDPIVKPFNADEIAAQWADVHGLGVRPTSEGSLDGHPCRGWQNTRGETVIETITIRGMSHGVPLAMGGAESCGALGPFFLEAGISSSAHIARFWGLMETEVEAVRPARAVAEAPALVGAGVLAPAELVARAEAPSVDPFNPNAVIAAAFAAGGLPVPKIAEEDLRKTSVAPHPIIEAVLKAAGMLKR